MDPVLKDILERIVRADDDANDPFQFGPGLLDSIDNAGRPYQSAFLAKALKDARRALGVEAGELETKFPPGWPG